MAISLDGLIVENQESLVDRIVKDAIGQIPSYAAAPLQTTIARVEQALTAVADSIRKNDPGILEQHLVQIAAARRQEGYAILELHAIVHIMERHLRRDVERAVGDEVERNALLALLEAVMNAARMVLSARYVLAAQKP